MSIHYTDDAVTLWHGDCIEVMRQMPDASVDAVVTDPPYGLEFMGKEWDSYAPKDRKNASVWDGRRQAQDGWEEDAAARSGKGGGGPSYKSSHKGAKRCTVCGKRAFSGSPCVCDEPEWIVEHRQEAPSAMIGFQKFSEAWAREAYRVLKPGGHLLAFGGTRTWHRLACAIEDAGFEVRDSIAWMYGSGFPKSLDVSKAIDKAAGAEREVVGKRSAVGGNDTRVGAAHATGALRWGSTHYERWEDMPQEARDYYTAAVETKLDITAPATPAARKWQGWGTALKPAFEPVVVARKPLVGTVAANVERYGAGALNIDASRIGMTEADREVVNQRSGAGFGSIHLTHAGRPDGEKFTSNPAGRWPANVILDESQAAELDRQSGWSKSPSTDSVIKVKANDSIGTFKMPDRETPNGHGDAGGASRFFYTAKADSSERPRVDGVAHPTVKPLDLMRYLVRLVTPPGGVVLEPFAGSGTTLEACIVEGFRCIGIEREADYIPLIMARITKPIEVTLL